MQDGSNFARFFQDSMVPMHEIEEGLYLGSLDAAQNRALLHENGVTHVLSILDTFHYYSTIEGLKYHKIMLPDSPGADILSHVPEALTYISNSLKTGKILVHCAAGVSRSASIVIAYVMVTRGLAFEDAKMYVKSKRGCIWPNMGFQRQISSINVEEYKKYLV